jgi:hypothetical protein
MFCIMLNALMLCTVWPNISEQTIFVSETVQSVCTWIFIVECGLKLIAFSAIYFHDNWNIFDFVLVTSSVVGMLFTTNVTKVLTVFRILRVCRVLRLLKKFQSLN